MCERGKADLVGSKKRTQARQSLSPWQQEEHALKSQPLQARSRGAAGAPAPSKFESRVGEAMHTTLAARAGRPLTTSLCRPGHGGPPARLQARGDAVVQAARERGHVRVVGRHLALRDRACRAEAYRQRRGHSAAADAALLRAGVMRGRWRGGQAQRGSRHTPRPWTHQHNTHKGQALSFELRCGVQAHVQPALN